MSGFQRTEEKQESFTSTPTFKILLNAGIFIVIMHNATHRCSEWRVCCVTSKECLIFLRVCSPKTSTWSSLQSADSTWSREFTKFSSSIPPFQRVIVHRICTRCTSSCASNGLYLEDKTTNKACKIPGNQAKQHRIMLMSNCMPTPLSKNTASGGSKIAEIRRDW
ncbi:hypothetical protein KL938_003150 [Ogataea parapolymorpha]|nr:hypothetical protein KL938_003150 [Ogataea parapolymorpha]